MRKILVVTDPEFSNEVVLNRIREVPKADTIFRIEHYLAPTHAKDDSAFTAALQAKQKWLDEIVAPLIDDGYIIESRVHAYGKLYEAIIESAVEFQADYIFKPLRHHGTLRRLVYTSTDWNLVRFCHCPILLVGGTLNVYGKPVLATLDLETQGEPHQALNQVVLERTQALSDLIGGDVHLVNAYNLITIAGNNATLDPIKYEVARGRREEYFAKAKSVAENIGVPIENVHLEEGAPEMVINHVAEKLNAGIIVLGTMARTGVSGLFIGNTAESVLESSSCDVFIVKQKNFVSPLSS
ncbi:MAG: universal stress protein E [Candidatus Azotimanducaceae bacterium]|jgi:universal stress protein E